MRGPLTLPLGIDVGATRVRIVLASVEGGQRRLQAIAMRDVIEDRSLPSFIGAAWNDLQTTERRCVAAIGLPHARLHCVTTQDVSDSPHTVVRRHPIDAQRKLYALGTAQRAAIETIERVLAAAGLHTIAIDHESLAFARALDGYDAIIDVAHARTSVHHFSGAIPKSALITIGSREITTQIQHDLAIDFATAEKRKRVYGALGGGETAQNNLVARLGGLVRELQSEGRIERIGLVGNGALLLNLAHDVAADLNCDVTIPESPLLSDLPSATRGVIAGTDANLAAGLSTWQTAG